MTTKNFKHLIGKRVKVLSDVLPGSGKEYGELKSIQKGRYPFIIKFDSGSEFGVAKISEIPIIFNGLEVVFYTDDDAFIAEFYKPGDCNGEGALFIFNDNTLQSANMEFKAFDLNDKSLVDSFITLVKSLDKSQLKNYL